MKYKVKRKNNSYIQGKTMLLIFCMLVIGFFSMVGFYCGKLYAIQNTKAYYEYGTVLLELDGNLYNVITEGSYGW